MKTRGLIAFVIVALAGCAKTQNPVPPRIETPPTIPHMVSTIVVPVSARLADLEAQLNSVTPQQLWGIDQREDKCVPAQRVTACAIKRSDGSCRIGIKNLKVTPDLSCRITGQVTRGRIALSGKGDQIFLTMPVRAAISAQDIGGIIKRETATGAAIVRATVKLSLTRDWNPTAQVRIAYDWSDPPGITILGKRILFVSKADAKLAGVIAGLERSLPAQLVKLQVRDKLASAWRQGFAVIQLNEDKPPVWMRVTPQRLGFGGYRVQGPNLLIDVAAQTLAETFVGDRPGDPTPTSLPPLANGLGKPGLSFNIPVLADYSQLEPVVERALVKRAAKGVTLPKLGPVDVTFGKVTIYATENGRLAVGVKLKAKLQNGLVGDTKGEVWMTGLPVNDPNSQVIRIDDLKITTRTDRTTVNLLLALFQDQATLDSIRNALVENFAKDYNHVLTAARTALVARREGDFVLAVNIARVTHGRIIVTGKGLFLPVQADGTATIAYSPAR
ncbi:MAG: DUF4403 family protein [Pseudomonadota bacterium]